MRNIEDIQRNFDIGYTMAVYGTREAIHEQMWQDINALLEINKQLQSSRGNLLAYPSVGNEGMTIREVFAKEAMLAVMSEAQEMRIASFWDWVKSLMVIYLHFNFLHVKYVKVSGAYDEAAKRAFEYADKMVAESEKYYTK